MFMKTTVRFIESEQTFTIALPHCFAGSASLILIFNFGTGAGAERPRPDADLERPPNLTWTTARSTPTSESTMDATAGPRLLPSTNYGLLDLSLIERDFDFAYMHVTVQRLRSADRRRKLKTTKSNLTGPNKTRGSLEGASYADCHEHFGSKTGRLPPVHPCLLIAIIMLDIALRQVSHMTAAECMHSCIHFQ
jgi:hypothetical protein